MTKTMNSFGFKPITSIEDFKNINDEDVVEGYIMGIKGIDFEINKSRSYYHGYLNGLNDGGFRKMDEHQKKLIVELKEKTNYIEDLKDILNIFVSEIQNKSLVN